MRLGMIIGGIAAALLVVVVGVSVFLVANLDRLVQKGVETFGSDMTQADVRLAQVEINVTSGEGALSGLMIGNPDGFDTPSAFSLNQIAVKIDVGTITHDVVVINEILISNPVVTYELGAKGSNIHAIKRNVEAYMAALGLGGATDDGKGPSLIIENFIIEGGQVNVSASVLEGKQLSAALPRVHLRDIGKSDGGVSTAQAAKVMLSALTGAAIKAAGSVGVGETLDSLKRGVLGKVLGNETADDVKDAVGSIFGRGK